MSFLLGPRFSAVVSIATSSSGAAPSTGPKEDSVLEMTQAELDAVLEQFSKAMQQGVDGKADADSEIVELDQATRADIMELAARVYRHCTAFDYGRLCQALGLQDTTLTYLRLAMLHSWMALLRYHRSLQNQAYIDFRFALLSAMIQDFDAILEDLAAESKTIQLKSKKNKVFLEGLKLQMLTEMDEGFLSSDTALAASLWRNLYDHYDCDPVLLATAVEYVRQNISRLDRLTTEQLTRQGIADIWTKLPAPIISPSSSKR